MPYRVIAADALAEWNDAVRAMDAAPEGSAPWRAAKTAAERARRRYAEAVAAAQRQRLPVPPPFPVPASIAADRDLPPPLHLDPIVVHGRRVSIVGWRDGERAYGFTPRATDDGGYYAAIVEVETDELRELTRCLSIEEATAMAAQALARAADEDQERLDPTA